MSSPNFTKKGYNMSNKELTTTAVTDLETQHIKVTPFGMEFDGKPSTEEWYDVFMKVSRANSMTQFYLGDMVVEAEFQWGEKYTDLVELTDYDYGTLRNYASISRRFNSSFREKVCHDIVTIPSFSAFVEVASLDDDRAAYYLRMVVEGNWSIARLREEVKRYKNGGSLPEHTEEDEEIKEFKSSAKRYFNIIMSFLEVKPYEREIDFLTELKEAVETRLSELDVIEEEE